MIPIKHSPTCPTDVGEALTKDPVILGAIFLRDRRIHKIIMAKDSSISPHREHGVQIMLVELVARAGPNEQPTHVPVWDAGKIQHSGETHVVVRIRIMLDMRDTSGIPFRVPCLTGREQTPDEMRQRAMRVVEMIGRIAKRIYFQVTQGLLW